MNNVGKKECVEFAMVCAVVLIVVGLKTNANISFIISFAVLLAALLIPIAFKPFAFVWYRFSRLLSKITSLLTLIIVYIIVLIPISFFRKIFAGDTLHLNQFRKSKQSVFVTRKGRVTDDELNNPF